MPFIGAAVAEALIFLETTTIAGITLETILIDVALTVGIGLVQQALLGGNAPKPSPPHAKRENFRQDITPRVKYYGIVGSSGCWSAVP